MENEIHRITKVPVKALTGSRPLDAYSVDERFIWAEGRRTSRPKDEAYCLIGIFDVQLAPIYSDGDRERQRVKAFQALKWAIEKVRWPLRNDQVAEDGIAIGGACYRDLSALDEDQLKRLDERIREFTKWLIQQGQPPTPESFSQMSYGTSLVMREHEVLEQIADDASRRMRDLLREFKVDYDDGSSRHGKITDWREPWRRFTSNGSSFDKVQGFLDNRWFIANDTEHCCLGMMAAKTAIGLILWRNIEDLRRAIASESCGGIAWWVSQFPNDFSQKK